MDLDIEMRVGMDQASMCFKCGIPLEVEPVEVNEETLLFTLRCPSCSEHRSQTRSQ